MSKPEFYACCPDCYNSHGDCADGGECPCHKGQPELRSAANWAATGGWPSGYQHSPATYVEGREAPAFRFDSDPSGSWPKSDGLQLSVGGTATLSVPAPDAATVEACARAAYVASWRGDPLVLPWAMLDEDDRARCREVARAVLAAAGRGGK